jgi:hypothetical protein
MKRSLIGPYLGQTFSSRRRRTVKIHHPCTSALLPRPDVGFGRRVDTSKPYAAIAGYEKQSQRPRVRT